MVLLLGKFYEFQRKVIEEDAAFKKSDMGINGNTLIEMGMRPGPLFSKILDDVFEKVLNGDLPNDKTELLEYVVDTDWEGDE